MSVKATPVDTLQMNCNIVWTGDKISSLPAFCNFRALNLVVFVITSIGPIAARTTQDYQEKLKNTSKPCWNMKMNANDEVNKAMFRYHDTTASWNFFILRIAIVPPAERQGLRVSKRQKTQCGISVSDCSSAAVPKIENKMIAIMDRIIMTISNFFIFSLRIKYASTTVIRGYILVIMAIIVRSKYFVVPYTMA